MQQTAAVETDTGDREFTFTDEDFAYISKLVTGHTGITLGGHKRQLVYGRLTRRLRQLNLETFSEYCQYVDQHLDHELGELVNAITTNLTSFFRENHHFEHLAQKALPDRMAVNGASRRLRLWSAGCSTGEEPYSIAMTVAETLGTAHRRFAEREDTLMAGKKTGVIGFDPLAG